MCAVGGIHNGLKVVFCYMHASHSHYHHYTELLTCIGHIWRKILEVCVNACWVYHVESVPKILLVLSVVFLIFRTICRVVCVKRVRSRLGEYIYISSYHHNQIRSFNLSHCSVVMKLRWLHHHMLWVSYISRESWVFCLLFLCSL